MQLCTYLHGAGDGGRRARRCDWWYMGCVYLLCLGHVEQPSSGCRCAVSHASVFFRVRIRGVAANAGRRRVHDVVCRHLAQRRSCLCCTILVLSNANAQNSGRCERGELGRHAVDIPRIAMRSGPNSRQGRRDELFCCRHRTFCLSIAPPSLELLTFILLRRDCRPRARAAVPQPSRHGRVCSDYGILRRRHVPPLAILVALVF